jgi:uncharacterized protein YyaL (SSP411 family)
MTTPASSTRPAHTNRLASATSPYLLQHAHNPVDWFPWGEEALEKARREDKPIFLSIGYSACHWCHVMERESFENEAIAEALNAHFVSIKVDREERPDLDEIYMNATMIANQGQGGWPMSVFLTPDGRPFFAGTYFPPKSRMGLPGFNDILNRISELWKDERGQIEQYAENLASAVRQITELESSDEPLPHTVSADVVVGLTRAWDRDTGGLKSGANKFPPSMAMSLMLREYHNASLEDQVRSELLELVNLTLDHMARGGIYDHLGGGIARYSTDPDWLVPHFEKMLYDQAQVSSIYIEAFQVTRNVRWADVAHDIFNYVIRDLQSPEGGFYSARDADSEGVEGKFYVWSKAEVMAALGPRAGELFCSYYDVTDAGNWEGHNILNIPRDLDTVARLHGIQVTELRNILTESRQKLLAVRERRVPPGLDDKILTSWNGLMIASMARGGRVTGQERYVTAAARAADFILTKMTHDGRLLRTYRAGQAHISAYLDDYAFFIEGLLELYSATFDARWLREAARLNEDMVEHFWDDATGAFFFTANDAEQLIVRAVDSRDTAVPSGNSVALSNLLRLAIILDRADLRQKAEAMMKAFAGSIARTPFGFDRFLAGVNFYYAPIREVVIVGPRSDPATAALRRAVDAVYDPHIVLLGIDPADPDAEELRGMAPVLLGKELIDGKPTAYVCRNYTCRRPVTSPDELLREMQSGGTAGSQPMILSP